MNLKKILVVLNHKLLYEQIKELEQFNFDIVNVTDELRDKWENIQQSKKIDELTDEILDFAKKNNCVSLVIQGYEPIVTNIVNKFGAENCYYYKNKKFMEQMKRLDGSVFDVPIERHGGFYNYKTNLRLIPSTILKF